MLAFHLCWQGIPCLAKLVYRIQNLPSGKMTKDYNPKLVLVLSGILVAVKSLGLSYTAATYNVF